MIYVTDMFQLPHAGNPAAKLRRLESVQVLPTLFNEFDVVTHTDGSEFQSKCRVAISDPRVSKILGLDHIPGVCYPSSDDILIWCDMKENGYYEWFEVIYAG